MSVRRHATLWQFDGYYEETGKHSISCFEPLETSAPKDAKPYIYLGNKIDFWKPNGNDKYDSKVECRDLIDVAPKILAVSGTWYEQTGGRVEWKEEWECWCMVWYCYKNTRMACMMNYGQPAYQETKLVLQN